MYVVLENCRKSSHLFISPNVNERTAAILRNCIREDAKTPLRGFFCLLVYVFHLTFFAVKKLKKNKTNCTVKHPHDCCLKCALKKVLWLPFLESVGWLFMQNCLIFYLWAKCSCLRDKRWTSTLTTPEQRWIDVADASLKRQSFFFFFFSFSSFLGMVWQQQHNNSSCVPMPSGGGRRSFLGWGNEKEGLLTKNTKTLGVAAAAAAATTTAEATTYDF